MCNAPLSWASPFSSYWKYAYYRRITHFIAEGDEVLVVHLALIKKRDALHTYESHFILPHPVWYRSLEPPRFLKLMLLNF
jgi:hypothetical protein